MGDDTAVIQIAGEDYLFSLDNFVEGTHFDQAYFSAEDIGWKALAVNISDIAAMSGMPLYAMVGLSLNKDMENPEKWLEDFYKGMQDCADNFGKVKIIGGDISSQSGFTSISVAIVGKSSNTIYRKIPDFTGEYKVCVSGKFGNSKSFLDNLKTKTQFAQDKKRHLRPEPRLSEAQKLNAVALMDASDGLAASLYTLAEMNNAHIEISSDLIPRDNHVSLEQALYGGEDYELVACCSKCPENFTEIGTITHKDKQPEVFDLSLKQNIDKSKQYQHF